MAGNLYSYTQVNERLATLNPEVKYDVHTLLNAIRLEKMVPLFWFDGYISDFLMPEGDGGMEDIKYTSIAPFKGFVELSQKLYASKLKDLFNSKSESIHIDFGQFFFIYDGEGIIESPIRNKRLFPYNVEEWEGLAVPFSHGHLINKNTAIGLQVSLDDLYFFKEQVDNFTSQHTNIVHDLKFEIEELKYQIEQLQERNEYLSSQVNKVHPALDPNHERFAPELYIALKLNDYVFEEQQKQKDSGGDVESHSRFADKFLDNNNVPGPEDGKLRGRLKAVSNSSSKKAPFINLAKSII